MSYKVIVLLVVAFFVVVVVAGALFIRYNRRKVRTLQLRADIAGPNADDEEVLYSLLIL